MLKRRYEQIRKALGLLRDPVFRRGLWQGVGASIEHRHQLCGLKLNTVVDIGANVGQFSLLTRSLFPQARVFAFEPLARPASKYRRLFDGDEHVRFHQKAIAPEAATRKMHVSGRDDSSSLLPISSRQVEFAPGTQEVASEVVSLATLDECISAKDIIAPALLKLDVQGFELEALKGCDRLLHLFEFVYAEVSFATLYDGQVLADELIDWLSARKFRISGASNPSYGGDKRIVQLDILFRHAD